MSYIIRGAGHLYPFETTALSNLHCSERFDFLSKTGTNKEQSNGHIAQVFVEPKNNMRESRNFLIAEVTQGSFWQLAACDFLHLFFSNPDPNILNNFLGIILIEPAHFSLIASLQSSPQVLCPRSLIPITELTQSDWIIR